MMNSRLDILRKKGLLPDSAPAPEPQKTLDGFETRNAYLFKEEKIELSERSVRYIGGDRPVHLKFLGMTVSPGELVFFDLETTGLSSGSGTVAFLAGLGRIEGEYLVLKQYFMPAYRAEKPMIEAVVRELSGRIAVSFNGRSYDMHLLKSRMIFLDASPFPEPDLNQKHSRTLAASDFVNGHIDLLPVSRRLYSGRLESCSLKSLERHLLGFHRKDDIDGSMAPELFFDYLNGAGGSGMLKVADHNRMDIVSLAEMLAYYQSIFESENFAGLDLLPTCRFLQKAGAGTDLEPLLLHEVRKGVIEAAGMHARKALKENDGLKALEIWFLLMEHQRRVDPEVYREIARIYEYRLKEYEKSLFYCESGLDLLQKRVRLDRFADPELTNRLKKQKERLLNKIAGKK
jgi:hypothetical protein